jgi:menaquinone-9 beta-reductase
MQEFLRWTKINGPQPQGHAYLIHGITPRRLADCGVLLIGDAAGLAYPMSGEGIRPAVESSLIAADAICTGKLDDYPARIAARFGKPSAWGSLLPAGLTAALGRRLLKSEWFTQNVVLDRWFLKKGPRMDADGR